MSIDTQVLSIAAHLHVLLRRKTGRVTDTEWMATDHRYATAMITFAKQQGHSQNDPDLLKWAEKLEQIVVRLAPASPSPISMPAPALQAASLAADQKLANRYVGRLR